MSNWLTMSATPKPATPEPMSSIRSEGPTRLTWGQSAGLSQASVGSSRWRMRLKLKRGYRVRLCILSGAFPWEEPTFCEKLWERLGLEEILTQALREREFVSPVEWAIFAMVSNRALAPDSKRGVEEWAREDVALGNPEPISLQHLYRAMDFLLEHEEAIQKEVFSLRPIFHRKDEGIRSHVLLCFLALLLVRIAERERGETWDRIRAVMERLHLGEFSSKDGRILRRTELTDDQVNLLKKLKIAPPPTFFDVQLKA